MKASTYHELAGYTSNVGSCQFTAIGPGGRWLDGSPALLRKVRVNSVKDRADEMKRNIIVSTHVNIQHPWRNIWTTKAFQEIGKTQGWDGSTNWLFGARYGPVNMGPRCGEDPQFNCIELS